MLMYTLILNIKVNIYESMFLENASLLNNFLKIHKMYHFDHRLRIKSNEKTNMLQF